MGHESGIHYLELEYTVAFSRDARLHQLGLNSNMSPAHEVNQNTSVSAKHPWTWYFVALLVISEKSQRY